MPCPSLDNLMVSPCFKLWLYIFYYHRDVDYSEQGDYAGGLKAGSRIEFRERDERNKFMGYNNVLEEQESVKTVYVETWCRILPELFLFIVFCLDSHECCSLSLEYQEQPLKILRKLDEGGEGIQDLRKVEKTDET
ncbi:hypothetical protein Bca4012_020348 [Brassica carinata]|uniref:Uncharacterized protein n=1 Tax=Brassica carinata TaxID=52824 RepID=A0A8X8BCY0_BRACI|nr:hypothetical protein Bca52824_001277 [Brassica carinata]